jgi:alpha-tubulin suppressor-like RCC1 family protein
MSCNGSDTCKPTPQQVTALGSSVIEISGGFSHTCALKSDKTVWCWGGRIINSTPAQVTGLGAALHVTSGDNHDCALLTDHTIWCWGDNSQGQLGNGTTGGAPDPGKVVVLDNMMKHVDAGRNHVCAVKNDGSLWCWGSNGSGELGNGTTGAGIPIPAQVLGAGLNVVSVAAGYENTFVIKADGSAACCGDGSEGQLGNGGLFSSASPETLGALGTDVFAIAPGGHDTCAIKTSDGTVSCWGADDQGQIGNNTLVSPQLCQQFPSMCTYSPTATQLPCP